MAGVFKSKDSNAYEQSHYLRIAGSLKGKGPRQAGNRGLCDMRLERHWRNLAICLATSSAAVGCNQLGIICTSARLAPPNGRVLVQEIMIQTPSGSSILGIFGREQAAGTRLPGRGRPKPLEGGIPKSHGCASWRFDNE